jgi:integrase
MYLIAGLILYLKWSDIDFNRNIIIVIQANSKNKKARKIPMSIMVSEVLQEMKDKSEYVFCNPETDEPYHSIKTSFGKALKRAGLEGVRFHDLRHTSATFMVTGGTDLATVKEILGHASIEMTMRYTHPTTEGKMGAVNAVANQMVGTDKHHSSTEAKITTLRKAVNRSVN